MAVSKALVLGFDGLSPLFFQEEQCAGFECGVLSSVWPHVSPAAWASYLTGVDPSVHGIDRWRKPGWTPPYPQFGHSKALPLWRTHREKTWSFFNVPCLKPKPVASNVTQFVGGLLWSNDEVGIDGYPVDSNGWEHVRPSLKPMQALDWLVERALRRDDVVSLDADITTLVYTFPDRISHAHWRDSSVMATMHRHVSDLIDAWYLKAMASNIDHFLVVSDHGFWDIEDPQHDDLLAYIGEGRVPWMQGGHHPDGVWMSNGVDLTDASIRDVLPKLLEVIRETG